MADEIITDGGERPQHTTIIERSGGSGAGLLIGFAVLILAIIAAFFVFNQNRAENAKTDAISSAAKSVERTADKAGDAIDQNTK